MGIIDHRRSRSARITGTRFSLFPQAPVGTDVQAPETIAVSSPAGSLGPGPEDSRMVVVAPVGKHEPYGFTELPGGDSTIYLPPWSGPVQEPVAPSVAGHFDHLTPGDAGFEAAHLFGTVRFVLDVWEGYFGGPMPWHFSEHFERLQISALAGYDNASAGYGFLETGSNYGDDGAIDPFALNFDIVAHEVGHLIVYSQIGLPAEGAGSGEYYGFHESAADLVALLAAAHFESVVARLLRNTRGNLYVLNHLNRIGELSGNQQIRIASNDLSLRLFEQGWADEHLLAQPLTGAVFDCLVDIFHELLLERGLISPRLEELADILERDPAGEHLIQEGFDRAFAREPEGLREAFRDARDYTGHALAAAWRRLSPDHLDYADVLEALLDADRELSGGRFQRLIGRNFWLRDIGEVAVGPRLTPPDENSHAHSSRTMTPARSVDASVTRYRQRWLRARAGRLNAQSGPGFPMV